MYLERLRELLNVVLEHKKIPVQSERKVFFRRAMSSPFGVLTMNAKIVKISTVSKEDD